MEFAALTQVLDEYTGETVVIGSYGTAMSAIVNYSDPSFGYEGFHRIQKQMPWIVRFTFEGTDCLEVKPFDLFANKKACSGLTGTGFSL